MATYNVELNHKPRKDGLHLLLLRITQVRKHKRISLGRYVSKTQFNTEAKYGFWIRLSSLQHREINEMIKSRISELEAKESEFKKAGKTPTLPQLINKQNPYQEIGFVEFTKKEIIRHRTHSQFRTAIKKEHLISKVLNYYGSEDLRFKDITVTFLKGYESHWTSRGNMINTIQTDFKSLRAIIRNAIQEDIIPADQNPFTRYRIKSAKTFRAKLDETEIQAMLYLDLEQGSVVWHAKNMFLLSFFCAGIRFGDLLQLKWKNVLGDHITYVMDKTENPHAVLLTPEAKLILSYYKKSIVNQDHFIFPFLKNNVDYSDPEFLTRQIGSKNTAINKYLKTICTKAGITKKVSFHISRHSFAYMAIRKTGDLYGVSKSLNHKNLNTTEIYLKETDPEAADSLMKRIFNQA